MARKFIKTLTVAGLALSASACGNIPNPGTEETGPKVEAGDIQAAADELSSVEVLNVADDGMPTFFRGNLGKADQQLQGLAATTADASLKKALPGVARLFRLNTADLVLKNVSQDRSGNNYFRYSQTKNGLPVRGAELLVHVNKDGAIFAANGSARDGSSLSATPNVGAEAALAVARAEAALSGSSVQGTPQLVYVRSTQDHRLYLAYEVTVAGGERAGVPVKDLVYVDAHGGSIVDRNPLIHSALNRVVYSANNGTSLPGTLKRSEGGAASGDTHVDQNYLKLGGTYDCYKNNFGRDSFDNAGAQLKSSVHYSSNYVNAYWDGTQMVYGDGDGVNSGMLGLSADVTTHELTHAVTERTSNLTYSGESGGLNEAMSDIFGAYCESYASGTWATTDAVFMVGDDIWTPATPNDALRYMYDPAKDGTSLDFWTSTAGSKDVHYSSGIANLAFTLLSKGGTHPRGKSTNTVTGIGVDHAGHIFYEANTNCLTAGSTFADAKTCTEQKATTLYGATEAASVTAAWTAVGVGGTTTPPAGCTTPTVLTNGVAKTGLSGATGGQQCFSLAVPSGATNLQFAMSGGTGDADLYVKFNAVPTTTTYDCRPYLSGNAETCTVAAPSTGTYYAMLNGYSAYSGVQLVGSYTTGGGGGGTCGTSSQLLANPGFESGNVSWTATSGVIDGTTSGSAPRTGTYKAYLDGYATTHTDTLYQQITIPSTACSANFSFWLKITTSETGSTAYDTLTVQVQNSSGTALATLGTYSNVNASTGYVQKSFDLSAYKGQTIRVYFKGVEDSSLATSFFIDDTAVNITQ
ncbi:M4 family metallopeptidase [Vitiosangium sp. GDMCC 1.1324]|uniref:M4 family metallopeptidase n=1 Tax=Vitiosangium sp. (strain GDMCC 1.1324) TaxID=2138576 RepID=UPI000D33666A|nr:M4 family metallopeptidase [Vitiosangium sp. GDMCC 1.1324]PTL76342.1 peptidase M4 [Vitiosangium sp. GDMCC 1.1324]